MLKQLQTLAACHMQAATHSFNTLYQRPLATLMTIMVIAVTLTLPALFWIFTDNLGQLTTNWQRGGHISLYLKSSVTSAEEIALVNTIRSTDGVGLVLLKTRADNLLELRQQEGMHDIMRYLPDNPLPAVVDVQPIDTLNSPSKIQVLYQRLHKLPEVDEAKLDMEWITRLHAIASFVTKIAHVLMGLLALAVVLIVANTLRLAIYHRHEEIQVLKLIGATDSFILRPFLYLGLWYGMAGAIVAIIFVNIFMMSISSAVQELSHVYHIDYLLPSLTVKQAYLIVFSAILLGWLGARLSVKKQLTSIEPYN